MIRSAIFNANFQKTSLSGMSCENRCAKTSRRDTASSNSRRLSAASSSASASRKIAGLHLRSFAPMAEASGAVNGNAGRVDHVFSNPESVFKKPLYF